MGQAVAMPVVSAGEVETAPRRVILSSLTASQTPQGLLIQWETALEWGVAGFEVQRQDGDRWTPVNVGLVVAQNGLAGGRYYVLDRAAPGRERATYRLNAWLASGQKLELAQRELSATGAAESAPATPQGSASKPAAPPPAAPPARRIGLAGPPGPVDLPTSPAGVKILTSVKGMHFVSAASLATVLGQSDPSVVAGWINSGSVALFNGGFDAAHQLTYVPGNAWVSAGQTGPGLFFYAEQIWNNYTTTNAYWLRAGANTYATENGGNPAPTAAGAYNAVLNLQSDVNSALNVIVQSPGTVQGEESDDSFWFWKQLTASTANDTWTAAFALDHLIRTGDSATLTINLYGATYTAQAVTVTLNGNSLNGYAPAGSLTWSGVGARQLQFTFPMSFLKDTGAGEGNNSVSAKALLPSGVSVSQFYVDQYTLTYRRSYTLKSGTYTLEANADGTANQTMTVSGFSASTLLAFDVTDPRHPSLVTGVTVDKPGAVWQASLKPATPSSRYVVLQPSIASAQVIASASALSLVYPSGLDEPATRASYVIVTHSALTSSASQLAAYRSLQFRTKVVVMDDIYNDFSFGIVTPHALESFIRTAYARWAIKPRYLVLLGDGSYDYRDLVGAHDNFVPPLMIKTPYGLFNSDSLYGNVLADGVPRVIVGRLPVRSSAEFGTLFAKIQSYETESVPSLQALLLADQPDAAGDFIASRNAVATYLAPLYTSTPLDPGYAPPVVTTSDAAAIQAGVQTALNAGEDLFNYIGHGAQNQFGIVPYVQVTNPTTSPIAMAPVLANSARLPIVVAMTCVAGSYQLPGFTSLAEGLLRPDVTGAVAVVAPTGLSQDSDATVINTALMRLFGCNTSGRLGDLTFQAFAQYNQSPPAGASTPFWIYNVLGDPALRVLTATP